jgi:hypothetical protein
MKQIIGLAVVGFCLAVCARTAVQPERETVVAGLPRPERILVYDFAVTDDEVSENRGVFQRVANDVGDTTQAERQHEIGRQVASALAEELVRELRDLGFDAIRVPRGTPIAGNALLISGQFLNVDEGNRLRRMVIGLGAGSSSVDTQVYVQQGPERRVVLEFATHADSGRMPGAALTMGAGAAVQGGATAEMTAANVAAGGVKAYRGEVERIAGRSADATVAYLSEFFARERWITPEQAAKARRV